MTNYSSIHEIILPIPSDNKGIRAFAKAHVPTGQTKIIPRAMLDHTYGVIFPGIGSCLPVVVWSEDITANKALAIHISTSKNTPDQITETINSHRDRYPELKWCISATRVEGRNEEVISQSPQRREMIQLLESLSGALIQVVKIETSMAGHISFRPEHGFCVVSLK